MKPVLIYHKNCPDGFGAAWSFWRKYKDEMEYVPAIHGDPVPDIVKGREVFIVDFSYSRAITLKIKMESKNLIILDHHKTADESIGDLPYFHYDVSHSGAYLAWKYLFGEDKVPNIIRCIEDRDLWNWNIENSNFILNVLDSYPYDFEIWDSISKKIEIDSEEYDNIIMQGIAIQRYKDSLIKNVLKTRHTLNIMGQDIPAVNAPFLQSELASNIAVGHPYSCAYYWDGERYRFSLRSDGQGADVESIAKEFGGGGHSKAAGFTITDKYLLNKNR